MNELMNPLDKYLSRDQVIASERFIFHRAHPNVSYDAYYEERILGIHKRIKSKRVIYLDTNAWKCLSDYAREKATLNAGMLDFAHMMNTEHILAKCVFPIGPVTLFELMSMNDPVSLSTLADLVDKYSADVACRPPHEVIPQELKLFNQKITRDSGAVPGRYCHPMDIMGRLDYKFNNILPEVEALAFKKTLLDVTLALPTSTHLEMATASTSPYWDNTEGIDEMNEGMIAHRQDIKTYADALLSELTGIMSLYVPNGEPIKGFSPKKAQALMTMIHWHENPGSKHLMTARIQANAHAAVRYLETRKFQKGDIADILTASIALPSSDAFFTDKRLANLLNESRIGLRRFCSCEVVSGFGEFAAYLKTI